jgi:hypothetical protein
MSVIGANSGVISAQNQQSNHFEIGTFLPPMGSVQKAIGIYLQMAYPDGPLPPSVKSITDKLGGAGSDAFDRPPFVRENADGASRYYLRLGNRGYPHMKLKIETWPGGSQYFFRVDAHDAHVAVPSSHPEFQAIANMCKANREIAEAIEDRWQREGLPTFKGCLAETVSRKLDSRK